MEDVRLILGDCTTELKALPDASVDCIITDPPYPCIKRSYGTWTEAEWFSMMRVVVPECMRILKPTGSAVFILQPNSERVGRMRTWLWEFMLWVGKEWGIVQDAWWWNHTALPQTKNDPNLLRTSVKACVWVGPPDCCRDATGVRWDESESNKIKRLSGRCRDDLETRATGASVRMARMIGAAERQGGTTPFNLLPFRGGGTVNPSFGQAAPTPFALCSWWLRYICPPGGTVLDPFSGSGTVSLVALKQGKRAIGIERIPEYHAIAEKRIAEARAAHPLFDGVA